MSLTLGTGEFYARNAFFTIQFFHALLQHLSAIHLHAPYCHLLPTYLFVGLPHRCCLVMCLRMTLTIRSLLRSTTPYIHTYYLTPLRSRHLTSSSIWDCVLHSYAVVRFLWYLTTQWNILDEKLVLWFSDCTSQGLLLEWMNTLGLEVGLGLWPHRVDAMTMLEIQKNIKNQTWQLSFHIWTDLISHSPFLANMSDPAAVQRQLKIKSSAVQRSVLPVLLCSSLHDDWVEHRITD